MNALVQSHGTKGTERARTWSCLGPGHHRPRRGGEGTQRAEKGAGETPALRLIPMMCLVKIVFTFVPCTFRSFDNALLEITLFCRIEMEECYLCNV